jgi:hypothetical protein
MQHFNLGSISNNISGLPDCWHIDARGESSSEVYQKHFNLPRTARKDRKKLESLLKRPARLTRMAFSLLHYRQMSTSIFLSGDEHTSPECHAMARYDKDWHLRDEAQLTLCSLLDPQDQARRISELVTAFKGKDLRIHQHKVQLLASRTNCTPDRAIEVAAKCALETWLRACDDLTNWSGLDGQQQSVLAEVVFAGFTLFGKEALEEAAAIEPQVLEHYRSFLGLPVSRQMVQGAGNEQPNAGIDEQQPLPQATPTAQVTDTETVAENLAAQDQESAVQEPTPSTAAMQPQSLRDLYEIISRICGEAQAAKDCTPQPAREIQALIEQHLERLAELEARMPPDEIEALIERYCREVLRMMVVLDFENSEQRDLVPVLRAAWRSTVISALETGLPQAWFARMLEERRDLPEMVARFTEESQKVVAATAEAQGIAMQLLTAKYTAKAGLKSKETRANNAVREAQQELDNIRVEVAECLVPDGKKLDDLMENQTPASEVQTNYASLDPSTLKSLKSVLESISVLDTEPPPPQEPVSLPAPAPASQTTVSVASVASVTPAPAEPVMASQAVPDAVVMPVETLTAEPVSTAQDQPVDVAVEPPIVEAAPMVSVVVSAPANAARQIDVVPKPAPVVLTPAPAAVVIAAPDKPSPDVVIEEDIEAVETACELAGVDDAIKHLRYVESAEEAVQAFRIAAEQFNQVPEALAEAIAMHWLKAGHLNVAHQVLRDANDSALLGGRVLDPSLLRSAFYGMNVWPKDREALGYMQRDLNLINYRDLDEQLERKPTGKLVPYLLAAATLQPALFAGKETQAPGLLKIACGHFDGPVKQLLTNAAEFSTRGGRVDWDTLREREDNETHLAAVRLQDQVNAWVDLNSSRTTRWHTLRVALKICCEEPDVAAVIESIRAGEHGDSAMVREFIDRYSAHSESRLLLDKLAMKVRSDVAHVDQLDTSAYLQFCQQVDALVSIARSWLLEVVPADVRPNETKDFVQRFRTQLERSISFLMRQTELIDLEHRAGSALLLQMLTRLHNEIKASASTTWRFDQTDATFKLPEVLAHLDLADAGPGPDLRLEWFATRLLSTNWLAEMTKVASGRKTYWAQLLLLLQRQSLGEQLDGAIEAVSATIAGTWAKVRMDIEAFKNFSIQAFAVDVVSEDDHLIDMEMAGEWMDKLSRMKPFVDIAPIHDDILSKSRSLEMLLNSSALELTEELNHDLLSIRTKVGPDAVPEAWEARARGALEARNLTVVRELVNQLQDHINRNVRLQDVASHENADLQRFLAAESQLYTLLHDHRNPREAGERVIQEQPGGFDYTLHKGAFKDAITTLMEWGRKGGNKKTNLDKQLYGEFVSVLQFVGLTAESSEGTPLVLQGCQYTPDGDFRRLSLRVRRPLLPKGFPLFEGDYNALIPLSIIFVQGSWSVAGLTDLIQRHGLPDRAVLMTGVPLNSDERKEFANLCKERKCTIFLLDPVVLSGLATAASPQQRFESFLCMTAPWTFYNPYTKGDSRLPAPPEMRFGRDNDIASLVEPRGAALVYGGRQLGKTTLLNSAVTEFERRDPARNRAFYIRMDGQFQHAVQRDDMDIKSRVLEQIIRRLGHDQGGAGLMRYDPQRSAEEQLRAEFTRAGSFRVLFCLDEIDSVLNKDARTNFDLIRFLVELVNDPQQRFRVVLAGLNNVNRFRTYWNVPLEQLGRSLKVEILPAQDARSLILQPLSSLGYCFEDPVLVDRIMAFTNRHPSLLHIFCSELVEQMGRNMAAGGGLRKITQTDVENIENDSSVRYLSGERFDMTLNLDKRYTVTVYGLIETYGKNVAKFTVKQALDVARAKVPEEFDQMNEYGLEAVLQELVGLGVLREVDKNNRQYAIRNQSILQLIGSPNDIAHKLQTAVNELKNHKEDALTCHPSGTGLLPSPLTLQDEKVLVPASVDGTPSLYSVSVIMGSRALGLTMEAMTCAFSAINEYQVGKTLSKFEIRPVKNAESYTPARFSELLDTAINTWAASQHSVVLLSLENCTSVGTIMEMIDMANEKALKASRVKHRLRIVFLLGARSLWSWHSNAWFTSTPSEIGGIVDLNRWTRHACESLLEQQGLGFTSEQAIQLHEATEGWYEVLMKFIEIRKKKKGASSFSDFSRDFARLEKLSSKEFGSFVEKTGVKSLPWSMPLAVKLKEFETLDKFNAEDVGAAIEYLDEGLQSQITPEQAGSIVRWWSALRVIEANDNETSTNAGRQGKVTYRFTLALQRAIKEHADQLAQSQAAQEIQA